MYGAKSLFVSKIPGIDKESCSETRGGSEACKSLLRTGTGERAKAKSRGRGNPYFLEDGSYCSRG